MAAVNPEVAEALKKKAELKFKDMEKKLRGEIERVEEGRRREVGGMDGEMREAKFKVSIGWLAVRGGGGGIVMASDEISHNMSLLSL